MTTTPRTREAGVQKALRHEVAGGWAPGRADRYRDLILAPAMEVGAILAAGDLGRCTQGGLEA
jgi:hypothetical protein